MPWQGWVDDYARVRDAIEATYPDQFRDFNARMHTPGGFPRPVPARERQWDTDSGKAEFVVPRTLDASGLDHAPERLRLVTLRSNDQFNTTIYGYRDRFRGIDVTRTDLPAGCIVGYYPECNPLLASAHHAIDAHVPAGKSIPVKTRRGVQAPVPAGPAPA